MEKISPNYASPNTGHYTPGVISHGMLYISGQLSIDPDTRKVPEGDIAAHARLALANLDRVLQAAGLADYMCRILTNGTLLIRFTLISSVHISRHGL